MKISDILFEYDQNKVAALAAKLKDRTPDRSMPPADSPADLAAAIEQMGVKSGGLVEWIVSRYLTKTSNGYGIQRWEDISSRAIPAILRFDQLKRKPKLSPPLPIRDINQIKTLSQLEDIVEKYPDTELVSQKDASSSEEQSYYDSKQATLFYNDATVKVVIPHTRAASCYFGKNTRWCTAARENNAFEDYKDDPLYIVLIKPKNERYQFSFKSEQYMDENDKQMNPNDLANQHPILWSVFLPIVEKLNILILNKNPSEQVKLAAVNNDGSSIHYIVNPSKAIQLAAVNNYGYAIQYIANPSEEIQLAAVKQNGYVIRYIENSSEEIKLAAVKNDVQAIEYIVNPSEKVQLAAVKENGYVIQYIENPSEKVQLAALVCGITTLTVASL